MKRFYPLILVFCYILAATALVTAQTPGADWMFAMRIFMGAFFFAFSLFKLLNLRGFAKAYASYDLVAKRSKVYAYAYPFLELTLGVFYLVNAFPFSTNVVTFLVTAIGSVGVLQSLRRGEKIQCACLGTFFDIPMSTVTLFEDLLMTAMALAMLVMSS